MMAETLLNCPFCGGEAHVLSEKTHNGGRKFRVGCYDPCCSGAAFEGAVYFDRSEAVAAWNRRVERTCRIVRSVDRNPASYGGLVHRCSSCGKAFPKQFFKNGWTRLNYCPTCGARVTGTIFKEDA